MGEVEVEDQVAGAEYLKTLDFIDSGKMAVQGHSYGGYMVLMSMFKASDVFKVGVADSEDLTILRDNGGRRIGVDRRSFSYSLHIPERRSHDERRNGENRRKTPRIKTK